MKKNLALLMGGYSGEYDISLKSGRNVFDNLDKTKYNIYPIIISKAIWHLDDEHKTEVDKADFSVMVEDKKIFFDVVFFMIHGTPGEDGKLQAYFDLLKIPYTGCNMTTSSLTFNKFFCKSVVASLGVPVAKSILLNKEEANNGINSISLSLPCFVKPNKNGSSVGISKVNDIEKLSPAISAAFTQDNEVLIEEFIAGREFTCGAFRKGNTVVVLPITEVVSKNEFFDYEAKYKPDLSEEITPAMAEEETLITISAYTNLIYNTLNCAGVIRADYIANEKGVYFLEVNATPGMSPLSIIPKQLKEYGLLMRDFLDVIIEQAIDNK